MLLRLLLVSRTAAHRKRLRAVLSDFDVLVSTAKLRSDFWDRIAHQNSDLILVSRQLVPVPVVKTIAQITELPDRPDIIVFTDRENSEERAELLAAGCVAVLHEDLSDGALRNALARLIGRRQHMRIDHMSPGLAERPAGLDDFVSTSSSMQAFIDVARRVVETSSSLLILGETGVGKERLARAIHNDGPRSDEPFIAINCGAMPESLLESELFGHEEGAFTGATRARRGYFELAHRGTIFLDEIGEMPLHLQVKLLRVLQEYEIQRIGSERVIPVDVRVMAASNRDLEAAIDESHFRRDLFYRLAVVALTIPPLRERREDLQPLVESYVAHFNLRLGRDVRTVSQEAWEALLAYSWPGNVRELINVIERAVLLCNGPCLGVDELPHALTVSSSATGNSDLAQPNGKNGVALPAELLDIPWSEARRAMLDAFELQYLKHQLTQTAGKIGETARRAGIQPRSLFEKMRLHGLRKEAFRKKIDR